MSYPIGGDYLSGVRRTIDDGTTALTASHAVHGVAVDISGMTNLMMHCAATGTGDTELKAYLDHDASAAAPTVETGLQIPSVPAGTTAATLTIATGAELSFPLAGWSGKWLIVTGKYSATDGKCAVYVTGVPCTPPTA